MDDFIGVPIEDRGTAFKSDFEKAIDLCRYLGVPLVTGKVFGPTVCLDYLGFQLDTDRMEIRLPVEKRDKYVTAIDKVLAGRSAGTKRDMLSLMGK